MLRRLLLGASGAAMLTGCFELPDPPASRSDCTGCEAAETAATSGANTGDAGTPDGGETGGSGEPSDPVGTDGSGEEGGSGETGGSGGSGGTSGADPNDGPQEPEAPQTPKPTKQEAGRFLVQASFGPNEADIAAVERDGFAAWIAQQATLPVPSMVDRVNQTPDAVRATLSDLFWNYAIEGEDQLRQRVAYALSQITVVSMRDELFYGHPAVFAHYMDILQRQALGNYQDLIHEVSLSPAMGRYLSSVSNRRADDEHGFAPDENYAREVMQLFTIGLEELNPDGTPTGRETYTVEDIKGLAAVFTGLSYADTNFRWPGIEPHNAAVPMVSYDAYHEAAPKTFLGATIDVGANAEASVRAALDHLLSHRNLAPFVSQQLIQKLVTANPSPAYVARVGAAFEAGVYEADGQRFGEGRRGDMLATVAAILLDEEARDVQLAARPEHGKVREPIMRFAQFARAFRDAEGVPWYGAPTPVNRLRYSYLMPQLGQGAYNPDSVFGFTRPDHKVPGSWTASRNMVAPNMNLAGGARTANYIRFMSDAVRGPDSLPMFRPDYARFLPLTDDPVALVDALDAVLTYGSLEDTTRARIVEAVGTVVVDEHHTDRDRANRMHLAVLMMVTSAEYGVLR